MPEFIDPFAASSLGLAGYAASAVLRSVVPIGLYRLKSEGKAGA